MSVHFHAEKREAIAYKLQDMFRIQSKLMKLGGSSSQWIECEMLCSME
jgi:hypothetical protein